MMRFKKCLCRYVHYIVTKALHALDIWSGLYYDPVSDTWYGADPSQPSGLRTWRLFRQPHSKGSSK